MEKEKKTEERRKPVAVFMAFGTKGDVYPIAAIAAAFACDQKQYHVVLVTHSAHQDLSYHLKERHVAFLPIKSPPVLFMQEGHDCSGSQELDFSLQKKILTAEHRRECCAAIEGVFGDGPIMEGDFMLINFFALEGWSLAELFCIPCVVAAPYVVPYSAPSAFERHFSKALPVLYKYLQEAPQNKVSWKDVSHWMWPLFTESWGSWRTDDLNLSPWPFTDPVTGLPTFHSWPSSPLLLEISGLSPLENTGEKVDMCLAHVKLQSFLMTHASVLPIFIGLSSIGSMGFLRNPQAFLRVIQTVLEMTNYRFILLTSGYEPLDEAVQLIASDMCHRQYIEQGISLFDGRLFCISSMIPYKWLFPKCAAAIHHGGSGSTAAALYSGIPQILCPFIMDQFYWAEKMHWLGVAPQPVKRNHLVPDQLDDMTIRIAANLLLGAISDALCPKIKSRALEIAERVHLEDGVMEAVKILKEQMAS